MKRYRVTLTADERAGLDRLLARGKADIRKLKHAQILLKANKAAGGPAWTDEQISAALGVGVATVERVRQRFVEDGLAATVSPYRRGGRLYETNTARRTWAVDAAPAGAADGRTPARRHALA